MHILLNSFWWSVRISSGASMPRPHSMAAASLENQPYLPLPTLHLWQMHVSSLPLEACKSFETSATTGFRPTLSSTWVDLVPALRRLHASEQHKHVEPAAQRTFLNWQCQEQLCLARLQKKQLTTIPGTHPGSVYLFPGSNFIPLISPKAFEWSRRKRFTTSGTVWAWAFSGVSSKWRFRFGPFFGVCTAISVKPKASDKGRLDTATSQSLYPWEVTAKNQKPVAKTHLMPKTKKRPSNSARRSVQRASVGKQLARKGCSQSSGCWAHMHMEPRFKESFLQDF